MRPADGNWRVGQILGYTGKYLTGNRFKIIRLETGSVDLVCLVAGPGSHAKVGETFTKQYLHPNLWLVYEEGTDDPDGIP